MRSLPLVTAALLLSACATGPRVRTDFDPSANFQTYRTYSWVETGVPQGMNPLMFARVKASIDRALAARGYTLASRGDFTIGYTIGERDRVDIDDWGPYSAWGGWGGWGRGWGWGGYGGWGWGRPYYNSIDVNYYTDRSVVIDIYDGPTNRPVWHGVATNSEYRDQVNYTKLDQAVVAALANFPPQPPMETAAR